MEHITPYEFVRKLNDGELEPSQVIDVREQAEWDYYHLQNTQLIPMQSIPARAGELPRDKKLFIVCAHGVRSAAVCQFLAEQGFEKIVNVSGGMAAVSALRGFQYD